MSAPAISIVLPVYRQADHIGRVIEEYCRALPQLNALYEIILVVNGSRDDSREICTRLAEQYPFVSMICSDEHGWGRSVNLGLRAAQGDLLCYTNSARTSARDLISLAKYALVNANVVVKADRKIRENWRRRLGSLLYNLECRALFDLPYWDINGTPKLFPRSFGKLLELTRNDDLLDLEFHIVCRRERYPILEVPIFSVRRSGSRSTTNYRSAVRMYAGALKLWRDARAARKDGE